MRDEVKMDANRLIAEVHKRPALWNQRHISYHNREVTNRVWMEIATIFKLPKPVLKAKWKGLRDTFRAELKKEQVFRKSKFHRTRPVWIHFKSLQFLKEQMLPRPPIWERKSHESAVGVDDTPDGNDDGFLRSDENAASTDHGPSANGGNFARHSDGTGRDIDVKREPGDGLEHLGFQNVAQSFSDNEMMLQNISPEHVLMGDADANINLSADPLDGGRFDDNYYFLMSLLPHIRTLAGDKQMWLRIQMQELVYKEVYKKNEPDPKQPSKNT